MRVDIRLFGGFEVVVDGVPIPDESWRRRDAAALVKLLAVSRPHRLLRDQVMDALWPDLLVEQAAPRLHKAAHYARAALGHRDSVVLSGDVVSLFPHADLAVDVDAFDEAAAEASHKGGTPLAAESAVEHYRGDLLPDDLFEPWAEEPRDNRRLRYVDLLRELGRWDTVLEVDPLDEDAHLRVAQDHIDRGDRGAALRQLDLMEKVFERELGIGPSEAALALRKEALAMPLDDLRWELRAARHAPVPRPHTPTIGRERDVALVIELLEQSPIVTLLGPGGVGKTRLALEVAVRRVEATSVQACFVDLAKVSDAGMVPQLVAAELGIQLESSRAERVLEEALHGRSLLLVLDNFEHVVDAAGIVGRLAQMSPNIRVLCTSRARLHVAGEQVFDVAPLPLEPSGGSAEGGRPADAIALFEQAATAVDPGFRLEPHLSAVASICRAVDGLPLAIELAASHVRTLSPPLLRARLATRLGSPTGAVRDMPHRQQTIPATIDWSLELLRPAERTLFARLGVFAGAVPLEAVEQVCASAHQDVLDALSRLVDQSLVRRVSRPDGEPRFVLLELLRDRARELLAGDEEADMRNRHAAYVASLLDDLEERRWTDMDAWTDTVTQLFGEIRRAHAWAEECGDVRCAAHITAGLGPYWHREGHHTEGRQWVDAVLVHADEFEDHLAARLHLTAGIVEWPRDKLIAREHWTKAIREFGALGDDRHLSYSRALVSVTYVGDAESYDDALALCDEAIDLARRVGEQSLIARVLNMKGELARVQGDDALALDAYEEGRDIAANDDATLGIFLGNLSFLADHRGDYDEARRLSRSALRLCWSAGRRMLSAWTMAELAGAELRLGRPELGTRLMGAGDHALAMLEVAPHPCDIPEHDRVVAGLRHELGDEAFHRLLAEGERLSLDEAVLLALSGHDDIDPEPATPA